MTVFLSFVALSALLAVALGHLKCQSPSETKGYRFESALTSGIIIMVVALVTFITAFTAGFTDGPTTFSPSLFWLGGIAVVLTVSMLAMAWKREARNYKLIGAFAAAFFGTALAAVAVTWVPANVSLPIVRGLTAVAAVALCTLGVLTPQTPGPVYASWLGVVAGLIVVITRRSGSVDDTLAWHVALGVGMVASMGLLLLMNLFPVKRVTGKFLTPVVRVAFIIAGLLTFVLTFAQMA